MTSHPRLKNGSRPYWRIFKSPVCLALAMNFSIAIFLFNFLRSTSHAIFLCLVNCRHSWARDKKYSYFRIPKIITHQGEETKRLSGERRQQWLKNTHRAPHDLTEEKIELARVCSDHFVSNTIYYCIAIHIGKVKPKISST